MGKACTPTTVAFSFANATVVTFLIYHSYQLVGPTVPWYCQHQDRVQIKNNGGDRALLHKIKCLNNCCAVYRAFCTNGTASTNGESA